MKDELVRGIHQFWDAVTGETCRKYIPGFYPEIFDRAEQSDRWGVRVGLTLYDCDKWNTTDLSRRSPSCRLRYRRGHATGTPLSNVHHTLSCASLLSGCPFRSGCSRDASSLPNSHVLVGHGFIIIDRTHFISGAAPRYRALVRTLHSPATYGK